MPESATPTTVTAVVAWARRSAVATKTEVVSRRSKPFASVTLKVTRWRSGESVVVTDWPVASRRPSKSVSQPTS